MDASVPQKDSILIADDDPFIRSIAVDLLTEQDYIAHQAESYPQAVEMLTDTQPDMVISDIRMPGGSGVDLLRWIKEKELDIPVIIITGYADMRTAAEALNLGAHYFLEKPFRPNHLLRVVEQVLAKKHLRQKERELKEYLSNYNTRLRQEVIDAEVELQKLYMGTLTSLAHAIDARDTYTHQHSTSVSESAHMLAKQLGLSFNEQDAALTAGQVHDLGKIAVPEVILQKPSRLTVEEYEVIKQHPTQGAHILRPLPMFAELVIPAVQSHHEFYNGSGYPHGLAGEAIPKVARILTVCDAFDAMTTDRPYRKGMPREKAASILLEERNKQFDGVFVEAFLTFHELM